MADEQGMHQVRALLEDVECNEEHAALEYVDDEQTPHVHMLVLVRILI